MLSPTRCVLAFLSSLALLCSSASAQKLKVYILAGQSNMEGHAKVTTFDYIGEDKKTAPLLAKMVDKKGRPIVCDDVWISYLTGARGNNGEGVGKLTAGFGSRRNPAEDGGKIGPEFTFGLHLQEHTDGPILIIKTAWGGKSLHTDFRPPSAGAYEFGEKQLAQFKKQGKDIEKIKADKVAATGHYYRLMMEHVKSVLGDIKRVYPKYNAKRGYELAGFVWFQGWNDMVDRGVYPTRDRPNGYAQYTDCMAAFIRDVRKDLQSEELPFVIGVMGVGGPIKDTRKRAVHVNFRAAMAAPARMKGFRGNVVAVPTSPYWDEQLDEIGGRISKVNNMAKMLRTKNKNHPNKDGSMTKQQQRDYVDDYRKQIVSVEETATHARGASNAGYHYLGCAKTMAQIGVAFADALLQMKK
jgi:alpha-galactosidase